MTYNSKPTLYAVDVSGFKDKALFDRAYSILSAERKEKISRFRFEKDKLLSLGAGVLLRYALHSENIINCKFIKGQNGKPYLENSDFYFNLSHSGEMAVCVTAPFEVGCDIEKIGNQNIKIAKKFFTGKEYDDIISSADSNEKFCRYWTLKESFLKAVGCGMQIPLNSFGINIGETVTVNQSINSNKYYFSEIGCFDNYRCAVCGLADCGDLSLCNITPSKILSEMGI